MERRMRYRREREVRRGSASILIARILLVILVAMFIGGCVYIYSVLLPPPIVQAVGNCKPGEKKVRHEQTGKCNCIPEQAVASPWVPDDSCSEVAPTIVPVVVKTITNAPVATETMNSTAHPLSNATSTPGIVTVFTSTPQTVNTIVATEIPGVVNTPIQSNTVQALTPIVPSDDTTCDTCELEKQQTDALVRIANALEKLVSWITR